MWVESLKKKEETVHPEEVSIYFCFILIDNINVKIETKVIVKKIGKKCAKASRLLSAAQHSGFRISKLTRS